MSELAADGIPVAVTCRVLKLARQPYYRWLANPVTDAELAEAYRANALFDAHRDDPEFGYRFLVDEARDAGAADGRADRVADLLGQRLVERVRQEDAARTARPGRRSTTTSVEPRLHRRRAEPAVADRHHRTPDRRRQALPLRDQGRLLQPDRRLLHRLADEVPAGRRRARTTPSPAAATSPAASSTPTADRNFEAGRFVRALSRHDMVGSMGRVGAAGDNAAMESFFCLLQKNVLDRRRWATRERAADRDRHLDRTDLPPPPTPSRPRPVDPDRVRSNHDHTGQSGRVTETVT